MVRLRFFTQKVGQQHTFWESNEYHLGTLRQN